MNKKRKKIISIWILIICLILLVYFIEGNYTIFYKLKELSLIEIFSLCALFIIFLWVNWIFFDTLSKSFNIKVKENFLLSVVTSFINLFTPFVGGMWFRARYTKKKYNLNYAHFTSCLFGNYIVVFLTSTFFGLLIFAYIYRRYKAYNIIFILLFFGIFLWSLFFVIFKKFRIKKKSRLFDIINKVSEWWQLISQNKQIIRKLTFLQIINLLIWVIQIYTEGWAGHQRRSGQHPSGIDGPGQGRATPPGAHRSAHAAAAQRLGWREACLGWRASCDGEGPVLDTARRAGVVDSLTDFWR